MANDFIPSQHPRNAMTGEFTFKPNTEHQGGPSALGVAHIDPNSIPSLREVRNPEQFEHVRIALAAAISEHDHERRNAPYLLRNAMPHFETDEAMRHLEVASLDAELYGLDSLPTTGRIEAIIADHDDARLAKGIALVDEDYTPPGAKKGADAGYSGRAYEGERHTGFRDVAEIAKECRAEIKKAKAAGYLPDDLDYSVTIDKYAGGQSMRVSVRGLTDAQRERDFDGHPRLTEDAEELRRRVARIADAWNRDDSDSMSDYFSVTYYSHVELESEWSRDWRLREAAKAKAKRDARKS